MPLKSDFWNKTEAESVGTKVDKSENGITSKL